MSELSDLLERFRRGPELLAMATTGAAGLVVDFQVPGQPLTVRQIVCHLADAEVVAAMRLRQIIAEDSPTLQYFDDERWAVKLDYGKRKISQALETLRRLRADNSELLKDLPPETFERVGIHSKDGPMTLKQVVEWFTTHLEEHVNDLQTIRAAYREERARQQAQQAQQ